MPTISLCMIVKDEEDVLARCLTSVQDIADEIIIVDTGSKDKTKEIARRFTNKIYDFKWINDFAAARNYSFSKATKDYILWLDADDVIEENNQTSFKILKASIPCEVDSVIMEYYVEYDSTGQPIRTTKRHRLVRRLCNFQWVGKIHEYLDIKGMAAFSKTVIHHKKVKKVTDRNIQIYQKLLQQGEDLTARDLIYYGIELVSLTAYKEALTVFRQFFENGNGWIEDKIAACVQMGICYSETGYKDKQVECLLKTFTFANPRSEICCRLGEIFLNAYQDIEKAIFWYKLAADIDTAPDMTGLLNEPHTHTWLPHLQLSVCYSIKENYDKAVEHCETALKYHPAYSKIQHNLDYLKILKENQATS